jgi:hypothetical protein
MPSSAAEPQATRRRGRREGKAARLDKNRRIAGPKYKNGA